MTMCSIQIGRFVVLTAFLACGKVEASVDPIKVLMIVSRSESNTQFGGSLIV